MQTRFATHASVSELMKQYGYQPKKSLGQNFLTDPRVAEKIVSAAQITSNDFVIEIGPGLGGLTQVLSEKAAAVLAIELDKNLSSILKALFADTGNVEIIQGDILKTDLSALMKERGWSTAKVAANLPYYITTPVIMGLLESHCPLSMITVMVQREVAERLIAKPGGKEYGAISPAVAYYAEANLSAMVPRNCFIPRPGVDSAVVTLELNKQELDPALEEILFKCIKAAFGQRRKTLLNCLRAQDWIHKDREELLHIIKSCGFNENIRGEALSLEDFLQLTYTLI
jgi:16S rRNA (adenine1518-N6/adenine1519-N6)-dimethyltransferase